MFQRETVESKPERTIGDLEGFTLILNDGSKAKELITFRGVEFVNNTKQHGKVQSYDGSHVLLFPESLHFIENPDIALIPQTSEDYCQECLSVYLLRLKMSLAQIACC